MAERRGLATSQTEIRLLFSAFSNDLPAEERVVQYQKAKEVIARGLAYHESGQQA